MTSQRTIKALKKRYAKTLLAHAQVASVGVQRDDSGDYRLVVEVTGETDDLPAEIDGHRLEFIRTDPYKKQ